MRLLLFFLIIALATPLYAAKVYKVGVGGKEVIITHHKKSPWKAEDLFCIYRKDQTVACGKITKTTKNLAKGNILTLKKKLAKGDVVKHFPLMPTPPKLAEIQTQAKRKTQKAKSRRRTTRRKRTIRRSRRRQPSTDVPELRDAPAPPSRAVFDLTAGANGGVNHLFPILHLQFALGSHFAIGLQPLYVFTDSGISEIRAYGAFLTANWYSSSPFSGLWIQGGAGLYNFKVTRPTTEEIATSFAFLLTGGYRLHFANGLNIGAGAGVQFIQEPGLTLVVLEFQGAELTAVVDVGFAF